MSICAALGNNPHYHNQKIWLKLGRLPTNNLKISSGTSTKWCIYLWSIFAFFPSSSSDSAVVYKRKCTTWTICAHHRWHYAFYRQSVYFWKEFVVESLCIVHFVMLVLLGFWGSKFQIWQQFIWKLRLWFCYYVVNDNTVFSPKQHLEFLNDWHFQVSFWITFTKKV